jgi:hypothetical protein
MRQYADDPQMQMAEDAAAQLESGASAVSLLPPSRIDLANSLAPFIIVFDPEGKPLVSSGALHGKTPSPPAGVLEHARKIGEHRLSWQPEPGVRQAIVVVAVNGGKGGFVLAGRSLRETELRKAQLLHLVQITWLLGLLGTLVFVALDVSRR